MWSRDLDKERKDVKNSFIIMHYTAYDKYYI